MRSIILLLLLLTSHALHAQMTDIFLPPKYKITIDTSIWSPLYTTPDPLMLYQLSIPQEFKHKPSGKIVTLQSEYTFELKTLEWLKQLEQRTTADSKFEKFTQQSILADPKLTQISLLAGPLTPISGLTYKGFDGYSAEKTDASLAKHFIWMEPPYFIHLYSKNIQTAEDQNLVKSLLDGFQWITTEEVDQAYQATLKTFETAELIAYRKNVIAQSHAKFAASELSMAPDSMLIQERAINFSYKAFDDALVDFIAKDFGMEEVLRMQNKLKDQPSNPYLNYYLPSLRRNMMEHQMFVKNLLAYLPPNINSSEVFYLPANEKIECYYAFTDSTFHLVQLDYRTDNLNCRVDDIYFDNWKKNNSQIERQHLKKYYSGPFHMEPLLGHPHIFHLTIDQKTKYKGDVHTSFSHDYFYDAYKTKTGIATFTPPKGINAYDALVQYEIDEQDLAFLQQWIMQKDTIRYFNSADLKDDTPVIFTYRGPAGKGLQTPAQKRIYGTNIFTTDFNSNGSLEYWQFYVSNGAVAKVNFFAVNTSDDTLKKMQSKLTKFPLLQHLIKTSVSNGINDHQLLLSSSWSENLIADVTSEESADIGYIDNDSTTSLEADTTIYQFPDRYAVMEKNDPQGEKYLSNYFRHKKFGEIPKHTHYKISFWVEKDGSLSHLNIRSLNGKRAMAVESQLLEMANQMPKWQPAYSSGKPVRSYGAMYFGLYLK